MYQKAWTPISLNKFCYNNTKFVQSITLVIVIATNLAITNNFFINFFFVFHFHLPFNNFIIISPAFNF